MLDIIKLPRPIMYTVFRPPKSDATAPNMGCFHC
jgi:hypothetical protein